MRFHDWRAARDRKARDAPPFSLPLRRAGGGTCLDWACHPGADDRHVILLHPAAHSGAKVQHRLLTYRVIKEICNAARELARFPAPFFSVLPDLFVLAEEMASGINGARLLIIPQSGHLSPLEQPTDVTQALIDLLRIPVDGNDI